MSDKKKYYKEKTWFYDMGMVTALWTWLLWFRPKRIYPNGKYKIKGGAVMCYNHTTPMDFMFILMSVIYRRHHILGMKAIFEKRFNRFILSHLLVLPMDKENFTIETYKMIMNVLRSGRLIDIFPEGVLNPEGKELVEFKDGPTLFALRSGVPLIPIYMKPRKSLWERKKYYFGDPLVLSKEGITKDNLHEGTILLKKRMQELKDYAEGKK